MRLFRIARVWIVVVHSMATAFAIATAALYMYFLTVPHVGTSMGQLGPNVQQFFAPTVAMASLTALGHAFLGLRATIKMILNRARTLSRVLPRRPGPSWKSGYMRAPTPASHSTIPAVRTRAKYLHRQLVVVWRERNAEIVRTCMLWEVALQTYQAHKISQLITSKSINRVMAVVIVTNCWFSPVLHYALGNRPRVFVRLCRLLIDSLLDLTYSVLIPVSIVYPYVRDYVGGIELFPSVFYYKDAWYINAVSELRQVFITSWLDFLSKFTGSLGLQYRLHILWKAISVAQRQSLTQVVPSTSHATVQMKRSTASRVLDGILVLWGIAVLGAHLQATVVSSLRHDAHCLLEMRPWGKTGYTCAALEVSCPSLETSGDGTILETAITNVAPASLQILIFANCDALHVPPAIQTLRNLLSLKLYNSTIASWDTTAALRETLHPSLQTIYLPRVNMSTLPDGLLAPDFPSTVWSVLFCKTNLSVFPDTIAERWRGVRLLIVEGNPEITEIPHAMLRLPLLDALGLRHNAIRAISDHALDAVALVALDFAGNPLQKLPESVGSLTQLGILNIAATHVSAFPTLWAQTTERPPGLQTYTIAVGSPLCASMGTDLAAVPPPDWIALSCLPDASTTQFFFPIDDEDNWRARSGAIKP